MNEKTDSHIAILGAGVIGAATAYYLSLRGAKVTVIEENEIACAASGYAGGFLALDWNDGSVVEQLARKSFELHAELADEFGERYDYRRTDTYSVFKNRFQTDAKHPIEWLSNHYSVGNQIGTQMTTAQVHPRKFTETLMAEAMARGVELMKGRVEKINVSDEILQSVKVNDEDLSFDAVIIALGPWSTSSLLGISLPKLYGLQGHSVVIENNRSLPAQALFVEDDALSGPEVVVRSDGEVYVSGISVQVSVPASANQVAARDDASGKLANLAWSLSPQFKDAKVSKARACIRPIYANGVPRIGEVDGAEGVYLACGHSVWGILNAPGTGLALSELILDGESKTIDLSPFDPGIVY